MFIIRYDSIFFLFTCAPRSVRALNEFDVSILSGLIGSTNFSVIGL
jgi:hypothetical protein